MLLSVEPADLLSPTDQEAFAREDLPYLAPEVLKGAAMSFMIAGILSMAFMGFAGLFASGA